MSRSKRYRYTNKTPKQIPSEQLEDTKVAENKRLEIFILATLFAFGIYQSAIYFGHQVVPNSDFPSFVEVARTVMSFKLPTNFKRLPGLGLLQVGLSCFLGGRHPVLTAGWLLNAILHPLNIVLFYLIGKRIIGRYAIFLALIFALNSWIITQLAQPMAETTLLFFSLLTFYLILRKTYWCYLAACLAAVIRYDAVVLILVAFAVDIFSRHTKKQKLQTLVLAVIAAAPLALWMIGTSMAWETSSRSHYLGHFTSQKHVGLGFFNFLWQAAFQPLLQLPSWVKAIIVQAPTASQLAELKSANNVFFGFSKAAVVIGVVAGAIYALAKKQWQVIALLLFFVITSAVHTRRMVSTQRYAFPLIWTSLLLCCYGWKNIFSLISGKEKIPRPVIILFQSVIVLASIIWLIWLVPFLPKASLYSQNSALLPYLAMAIVVLISVAYSMGSRKHYVLRYVAISAFCCLMIVSNQFILAKRVGNGQRNAEFKMLADWFAENSQPGEKLATSLPKVVSLFVPDRKADIVHISNIGGVTPQEFVARCYKNKVTYVAWDSRIGLRPKDSYYKKWRIDRIAPLIKPEDNGPYEYVKQVGQNKRMFINIFRLKKL